MAVDERARHNLFLKVEETLGPETAEALMEMLPPVGWADVATNEDLRQLEERIGLRFDGALQDLRADLFQAMLDQAHTQFRNIVMLCTTMVFAVAGLAFAAAKLT